MRSIKQSISVLVLGISSLAFSGTAPADSRFTIVYSSDGHTDYPYTTGHRHYQPRRVYQDHVCALPYQRHSHKHDKHDKHGKHGKHGKKHHNKAHYKEGPWIDHHGYHHRDYRGYRYDERRDKRRHADRHDFNDRDRHRGYKKDAKHRQSGKRMRVTRRHTDFDSRNNWH